MSPLGDAGSLPFQGPKGETVGSITQPLPSSYLIFRAASESDGESLPALWVSPVTPPPTLGSGSPGGFIDQEHVAPIQALSPPPKKAAACPQGTGPGAGSPAMRWYLSEPQCPCKQT